MVLGPGTIGVVEPGSAAEGGVLGFRISSGV